MKFCSLMRFIFLPLSDSGYFAGVMLERDVGIIMEPGWICIDSDNRESIKKTEGRDRYQGECESVLLQTGAAAKTPWITIDT
jgi:hypothetical protein